MYLNKTSGNLNPRGQQPQSLLQTTTVRSFEGGLNVSDTDLNMSPKFARVLDNLERQIDGSLALRPGTKLFSVLPDTTYIVNCTYFNGYIIAVTYVGLIYKVAGDGTVTKMSITLAGYPDNDPWFNPDVEVVNFTIFNSDLILTNGRDKPLIIAGKPTNPNYMELEYLVDLANLTNVNTPVGKYVISHAQYTCIAGVETDPSTLFISAKDTSGTYVGDDQPNDAVNIDLGPRVSLGSATITGMVAYRDKLVVTFERGVLPINLGVYTGSPLVHAPTDDGFIEEYGCMAHRSLVSVGDDVFYCDNVGVNSITRINIFNTLRPIRASHLIDPLITAALQPLSQAQIAKYVFAIYDLRNFRYMLFVPILSEGSTSIQEIMCFSFSNIPALKVSAWARLRGVHLPGLEAWFWQAACRTELQNVIFARDNKLYSYDFDNPDTAADFLDDPDFRDGKGVPIEFDWEMPWADLKHRMNNKHTRYIGLDTQGDAEFTVEAYVDNLKVNKKTGENTPLLSMTFLGGDTGGYGNLPYGDAPYGGGRDSSDERLYEFPAKFRLLKLRFFGSTKRKLKFVSVSLGFLLGTIRR